MKNKIKCCFSNEVRCLMEARLQQLSGTDCHSEELKVTLEMLVKHSDDAGRLAKHLKQVEQQIKSHESISSSYVQLFCQLFIYCHPKHICKTRFMRLLQTLPTTIMEPVLISQFCDLFTQPSCISRDHITQTLHLSLSKSFLLAVDQLNQDFVEKGFKFLRELIEENHSNLVGSESDVRLRAGVADAVKCLTGFLQLFGSRKLGQLDVDFMEKMMGKIRGVCCLVLQDVLFKGDCWTNAGFLAANILLWEPTKLKSTIDELLQGNSHNIVGLGCGALDDQATCAVYTALLTILGDAGLEVSDHGEHKDHKEHEKHKEHREHREHKEHEEHKEVNGRQLRVDLLLGVRKMLNQMFSRTTTIPGYLALAKCYEHWTTLLRATVELQCEVEILGEVLDEVMTFVGLILGVGVDALKYYGKSIVTNICQTAKFLHNDEITDGMLLHVLGWNWSERPIFIVLNSMLVSPKVLMEYQPDILSKLLHGMQDQTVATYISQLYCNLASTSWNGGVESGDNQMEIWFKPVLMKLHDSTAAHSKLLHDYLLVKLVKLYGPRGVEYADAMQHNMPHVYIMCLQCARKCGLAEYNGKDRKHRIDSARFQSILTHHDDKIRLDGFAFLCDITGTIGEDDITMMKFALPYNISPPHPAFQHDLFNHLKKFLQRLVLNHQKVSKQGNMNLIQVYKEFGSWLIDFLFQQFSSGSASPRRNLSLRLMKLISGSYSCSGLFCGWLDGLTSVNMDRMMGLLDDPYEENRLLVVDILTMHAVKPRISAHMSDTIDDVIAESSSQVRTSCKPEVIRRAAIMLALVAQLSSDTNSHVLRLCGELMAQLSEDTMKVQSNIMCAATSTPLYGTLHAIHMLLTVADIRSAVSMDVWRGVVGVCVDLCFQVSTAVAPVVTNASPEGFIPGSEHEVDLGSEHEVDLGSKHEVNPPEELQTTQLEFTDHRSQAQRILFVCWHGSMESLLLLQHLIHVCPLDSSSSASDGVLSWDQLISIGEHIRTQLMQSVHRGAFEVAYAVFRSYCHLVSRLPHIELRTLPYRWAREVVDEVCDAGNPSGRSSTRRSAGIPFLLQGILGSSRCAMGEECLDLVMASLLNFLQDNVATNVDSIASQIHALNILMALVKDAALGEGILQYISRCIIVAVTGFSSSNWSIRNASTLFFTALTVRVFGVKRQKSFETSHKNRLSSYEFFTRFPKLHPFLLQHLQRNTASNDLVSQSSIFPVLLILSRITPSVAQPNPSLQPFIPLVIRCGCSPIYKCRVMSATTLASILHHHQYCDVIIQLITSLKDTNLSQNHLHGGLLQLRELTSSMPHDPTTNHHFCKFLCDQALQSRLTPSALVLSAYINLFVDCCVKREDLIINDDTKHNFTSSIPAWLHRAHQCTDGQPGSTMLHHSIADLLVCSSWRGWHKDGIATSLASSHFEVRYHALSLLKDIPEATNGGLVTPLLGCLQCENDHRCIEQIFLILSQHTTQANHREVWSVVHNHSSNPHHTHMYCAISLCYAKCFECMLTTGAEIAVDDAQRILTWLNELNATVVTNLYNPSIRHGVAGAFQHIACMLLGVVPRVLVEAANVAWRILFILLVDDESSVRSMASTIVHQASTQQSCHPCVESFTIELAAKQLVNIWGERCPSFCRRVLNKVQNFDKIFQVPSDTNSMVFAPSISNSFYEANIINAVIEQAMIGVL